MNGNLLDQSGKPVNSAALLAYCISWGGVWCISVHQGDLAYLLLSVLQLQGCLYIVSPSLIPIPAAELAGRLNASGFQEITPCTPR